MLHREEAALFVSNACLTCCFQDRLDNVDVTGGSPLTSQCSLPACAVAGARAFGTVMHSQSCAVPLVALH